jgi:alkylation response protein AidB-like acyl-CoA dehydrogenase
VNFELTDDQKMLRTTAANFAKKQSPIERARVMAKTELGFDPAVWRQMGELGWLGITLPESVGGYGGDLVDACLLIEQLATTLVPEPYLPAIILGGMALVHAGSPDQQTRWLEPLCEGRLSLALAYAERQSRFDAHNCATRAAREGGSYRLHGEKIWVLNGHAADAIIVSARTAGDERDSSGVSLFVVDRDTPGLTVSPVNTMDGRKAAMLRLDGVVVGEERRVGSEGEATSVLNEIFDLGAAAVCAEGVGICQTVLDMTTEYLKTREQFGVKIGSFQALQHRAVDMFIETELLRSHSIEANIRMADRTQAPALRQSAVSAAKVQMATGGKMVVQQGIQLHGGIAITEEHNMGLYFKRMHIINTLFGDEEHHLERLASLPGFDRAMAGIDAD